MKGNSYVLRSDLVRQNVLKIVSMLNLSAKSWEIVIREYKPNRKIQQNALYWKWLTVIASETGNDKDVMHEYFAVKFLGCEMVECFGETREKRKSTADLKVKEFAEYLNQIEAFAVQELGIVLPHPDDLYHQSMMERAA